MDPGFRVSVVMPVYNAAKYLRQAVLSAVNLEEVGEIVLVEDKSPDNALQICHALEHEFDIVRVYQHPNGENRGAGASRNLGIKMAKYEYISFLDADDVYLPNRFYKTSEVFNNVKQADGVYSAAGFIGGEGSKLYTIHSPVPPEKLFSYLVRGTFGHFHTNGITLRKSIFEKTGYFNPALKLGQDADLWLRIAFHCSLYAGEITQPTCLIRRHDGNRILQINDGIRIEGLINSLEYFKRQRVSYNDYLVLVAKLYRIYLRNGMIKSMLNNCRFFLKD